MERGDPVTNAIETDYLLGVSGWLGGKLAYRYGVRVVDEETQVTGFSHN